MILPHVVELKNPDNNEVDLICSDDLSAEEAYQIGIMSLILMEITNQIVVNAHDVFCFFAKDICYILTKEWLDKYENHLVFQLKFLETNSQN